MEVMSAWAHERNYQLYHIFHMPVDLIARLRTKIIHKSTQRSRDHPNVIIIKNDGFFLTEENYPAVVDALIETVYQHPNLVAVAIIDGQFGTLDHKISASGLNYYIQKKERHAYSSRTLFLLNRFCQVKLTPHTLARIFEAFQG
jgi:hypothetical protein